MKDEPEQIPRDLVFIGRVLAQIAANDFSGAIEEFMEGLEHLVISRPIITTDEFNYHLAGPLRAVIRSLLQSPIFPI